MCMAGMGFGGGVEGVSCCMQHERGRIPWGKRRRLPYTGANVCTCSFAPAGYLRD